jgi:VWFA-related protein
MTMLSAVGVSAAWLLAAPPTFVNEALEVRVDVVVSRDGAPVTGLRAGDFELLDDGAPQDVSLVASEQTNVHAVLVLDQSESLSPAARKVLKDAAAVFLDRMEPGDMATLLTFTHDLTLVSGPDAPDTVKRALEELDGSGTTALYDAIHAGLIVGAAAPGRPFVVVFTDGVDRISWITARQLLQAARLAEGALYFVSTSSWSDEGSTTVIPGRPDTSAGGPYALPPPARSMSLPQPTSDAEGRAFLRAVAAETGGRVWTGSGDAIEVQFIRTLAEVKSRYLLAYAPASPTPGWHTIEIRMRQGRGEVRARRGYFSRPP